ncbi:MAG: chemotaxis-specific protein-glutamate methyltransferase CheB [Sphingorhabdus sp.]
MTAIQTLVGNPLNHRRAPIRVMLVDDSIVARSIFARVLGNHEQIEIVCEAEDSESALDNLATMHVDIILLDIEMPKRSGLDALPDIQARAKGARILVVSAFAEENGPAAIQALSLGACDTLAKPGRSGFSGRFSEILIDKVIRLGRSTKDRKDAAFVVKRAVDFHQIPRPSCIAIGSSTGGIPAIYEIVRNMAPSLDCPIFITQHLPEAFMPFFARQLGGLTDRVVKVAEPGEIVRANHIYIAPGHAHLVCRKEFGKVVIDHQKHYSASRYCPSVDAMFESIAQTYSAEAIAVIFSGMGNDGVNGARRLSETGAAILVQDVDSSVVWGMPGAVAKEGLATAIVSPEQISGLFARIANSA